ncbi:hydroxysqualene dehydroxylase HpnE [Undibacterium sp. Dicai25W]|uniref:hydroxysqualene dehydroxylase HpnE n=1 Tax=Undibacterium sp. Dicai25W TaxID=3413034 RepID=UPI003BF14865
MAKSSRKHIAVIGGGWAGCAAAVQLTKQGHQVSLFEASRTLGGRARAVEVNGLKVDNGQHILLGAYQQSLQMMREVGIDMEQSFLRLPLQMIYPSHEDGMQFIAPKSGFIPAPLHLLIALWQSKGLEKADKLALARFSSTARWMGWKLYQDCSVSELLQRFDQTERLCRLMWNPLCVAALNTPPERASAQVFLNVLRDSLGAKRAASDMLIPQLNLSALFPEQAAVFIQSKGNKLNLGQAVTGVSQHTGMPGKWQLNLSKQETSDEHAYYDGIIIATDCSNAKRLLKSANSDTVLPEFAFEAITTCYLNYAADIRLPGAMHALCDAPQQEKWGQYVFDRGYLHIEHAGLLAVVISAPQNPNSIEHDKIASAIASQLAESFQLPALKLPLWHQIITEKRATFSCTPGLARPPNTTDQTGLLLAGDYTAGDYPATIEAAVRSGISAAKRLQ